MLYFLGIKLRGAIMKKEHIYEVFSKIPTFETERLIIRPMRMFDAFDMYEYARMPKTTEFLTWSPHPGYRIH